MTKRWLMLAAFFLANALPEFLWSNFPPIMTVATALEIVWSKRGFAAEDAGMANGLFIFGGMAGGFLMPLLQNRLKDGRFVLIICYLAALLLTYPLFVASSPRLGNLIAIAIGIFWLGSVPVSLTLMEKVAGASHAGAASGLYWAFASAGSVALVWLFGEIIELWSWQRGAAARSSSRHQSAFARMTALEQIAEYVATNSGGDWPNGLARVLRQPSLQGDENYAQPDAPAHCPHEAGNQRICLRRDRRLRKCAGRPTSGRPTGGRPAWPRHSGGRRSGGRARFDGIPL